MTKRKCGDCEAWDDSARNANGKNYGLCHLSPRKLRAEVTDSSTGMVTWLFDFVPMHEMDWCMEFQQRRDKLEKCKMDSDAVDKPSKFKKGDTVIYRRTGMICTVTEVCDFYASHSYDITRNNVAESDLEIFLRPKAYV